MRSTTLHRFHLHMHYRKVRRTKKVKTNKQEWSSWCCCAAPSRYRNRKRRKIKTINPLDSECSRFFPSNISSIRGFFIWRVLCWCGWMQKSMSKPFPNNIFWCIVLVSKSRGRRGKSHCGNVVHNVFDNGCELLLLFRLLKLRHHVVYVSDDNFSLVFVLFADFSCEKPICRGAAVQEDQRYTKRRRQRQSFYPLFFLLIPALRLKLSNNSNERGEESQTKNI